MRRISNRKMENSRQNVQLVGGIWLFWLMVAAWRLALEKGMVPVRDVSSGEREARRKRLLRRADELRRENAGRRRLRGGRLNSGEAAVVGGDSFFGCAPPAEYPFTGGNCQLRRAVRSSEWGCASEINSCERMFAGGGIVAGG